MSDICGKPVGKGAMNFGCRELPLHDGPCATFEVPASAVERKRWEAEQRGAAPIKPDAVSSTTMSLGEGFNSHDDRLALARGNLNAGLEDLPKAIKSWMMGAAAQLAWIEVWQEWQKVRATGGTVLTLTEQEINQLIPENLRVSSA